ncbi:hypothetical protein [Leucobacter massiliensis]|uniref:UDP-N-acetyl-alpha-D-muramoyl-L-alanyl-L-glutamate epimerase n=1 Tax=Leucobacter massiliensis TaxID=1686285 RepID=A0A2S9QQ58_9MICO|nr:hypothetical protein [Leucobacter massiliensis]PRI11715.1 hypothetical protein B4915_04525 [Leucobacter massiliensis]
MHGATVELRYVARAGEEAVAEFTEHIELPRPVDRTPVVDGVLRLLSLAASLSYFKACAPAALSVPGGLSDAERAFARAIIAGGLGEFAFVNDLPEVLESEVLGPSRPETTSAAEREQEARTSGARTGSPDPGRLLVAVGGGKDSIVSIEALRRDGLELGLFAVNTQPPMARTAEVAGLPLHEVRRTLDPELFALNAAGAPNGHVPVTAVNSLIAQLTALALGYDTVVFSNEAGSSFGNFVWAGRTINHQWSKGSEFEGLLRETLPAGAPDYVSLLRPVNEIRIARRFASLTDYHPVFTSCNRAFRIHGASTSWCGDCPKCRFIFLMLAPFLSRAALLDIFDGRDLFADEAQASGFLELFGVEGLVKPFECVGEPDECRVALSLLREHADWHGHAFLARPEVARIGASEAEREAVFAWRDGEHFLSPRLEAVARAI